MFRLNFRINYVPIVNQIRLQIIHHQVNVIKKILDIVKMTLYFRRYVV